MVEVVDTTKKVGVNVEKKYRNFREDFKKFVAKGNVVDLAIAVVIGAAFNKIVNTLVSGIITPITSLLLCTENLADLKLVLREAVEADEAIGQAAIPELVLSYGALLQAIIDFLIIALSIYFALKIVMKLKDTLHKKERLAAEQKAKELAEKKKAEADEELARQQKLKDDFVKDVAAQADALNDIKEILLRLEAERNKQ